MDPIFIYYNNLEFKDKKIFNIEFSNEDRLQGVMFKRDKDYYLTSMSCFIELDTSLNNTSFNKQIIEISTLSNEILKNGIDHKYKEPELEITFGNITVPLEPVKTNRSQSAVAVEFFDHITYQKRLALVYQPYKELKEFGLKFEKKNKSNKIAGYTISLKEVKDTIFLEKQLYFDKTVINDLFQNYKYHNIIFFEYNSQIYPYEFDIVKLYYEEVKNNKNVDFQSFFYKIMFPTSTTTYRFLFEKAYAYASGRWPIVITSNDITFLENVNYYITEEMYVKNKSFFENVTEIGEVAVTNTMLQNIRKYIDSNYNVTKIYGFRPKKRTRVVLKKEHFAIPDFNFHVRLKDAKSSNLQKQVFNFSILFYKYNTVLEPAPNNIDDLSGQVGYIKNISAKIDLKSVTHAFENFFLYDLEEMIKTVYATELNRDFSIYGLISFSGETKKNNKLDLIKPNEKIKFQLIKDTYKENIKLELGKVHKKKSFTVISDKIFNFGILRTKKRKSIGSKRIMGLVIKDSIKILGFQNSDYNFLNPIKVSVDSDNIIQFLTKYRKYKYRFVLQSILFSSNFSNETDVLFISCDGLSNAKEALINSKIENVLGVCYLNEVKDWKLVKGQSKRSQAVFVDSEELTNTSHFSFPFTTTNLSDLLQFTVTLLDGDSKKIVFPAEEKKTPIISFEIQVVV